MFPEEIAPSYPLQRKHLKHIIGLKANEDYFQHTCALKAVASPSKALQHPTSNWRQEQQGPPQPCCDFDLLQQQKPSTAVLIWVQLH